MAIGRLQHSRAKRVVDLTGLFIAPGFIDMMGQTGLRHFSRTRGPADNLLTQGITTINAGEGESDAPLDTVAGKAAGWQTMAEFFNRLETVGMPLNVVQTVGHTRVRRLVLGDVDRQASARELEKMKSSGARSHGSRRDRGIDRADLSAGGVRLDR